MATHNISERVGRGRIVERLFNGVALTFIENKFYISSLPINPS